MKAHLVDSERAASTYSYPIQAPQQKRSEPLSEKAILAEQSLGSGRKKRTPKLHALKPLLLSFIGEIFGEARSAASSPIFAASVFDTEPIGVMKL